MLQHLRSPEMKRTFARTLRLAPAAALAALAFAASASAHQTVTIDNGPGGTKTLHIVGDVDKTSDTVTITYDSVKDEYVITHDVVTFPAGCIPIGSGPPYKEVHCPQKGITHILVETGAASDVVKTTNIRLTTLLNFVKSDIALFFPPDLIGMDIKLGSGGDSYVDQPALPAASVTQHSAGVNVNAGGGNDSVTLPGGGANTFTFGTGNSKLTTGDGDNTGTFGTGNNKITVGNGNNVLTLGNGNSNVYVGAGDNRVVFGDGDNRFAVGYRDSLQRPLLTSTGGTNVLKFGRGDNRVTGGEGVEVARFGKGNSTFAGDEGDDRATFGAGVNKFVGGGGDDIARLGAGADKGLGGAGDDRLFGGADNDRLLGGSGFDLLSGGGGRADRCAPGTGGGKLVGCER
jgi:Ca2+-binding RTX toxin-like protein